MTEMERQPVFVLLHGGGMGPWIWQRLSPLLRGGVVTIEDRYPAAGPDAIRPRRVTLDDCARHVARAMEAAGAREVILVAHSGAGIIAPYVARHTRAVRHIVFISANIPAEGTSAIDGLPFWIRLMNAAVVRMMRKPVPALKREKMLREHFLNASPEDVARLMLDNVIRPEPLCAVTERVRRAGIALPPATYVKCLRDRTLSPEGLSRMAANYGGARVVEVDADHMVMLSRPQELADVLNAVAEGMGAGSGGAPDAILDRVRAAAAGAPDRRAALQGICAALHDAVPRFDWVGFYLADPHAPRELVLGPFVGEPTEHVRIPFGRGVCGQAAERRETVVVDDVSKEANYLSCSAKVRSEIVLPLLRDGAVLGELDIDSHTPRAFTDGDRRLLEAVCGIAVGLL
jgi:L-methionine (R)-S-oxide reductase